LHRDVLLSLGRGACSKLIVFTIEAAIDAIEATQSMQVAINWKLVGGLN